MSRIKVDRKRAKHPRAMSGAVRAVLAWHVRKEDYQHDQMLSEARRVIRANVRCARERGY